MRQASRTVRLTFADEGSFHTVDVLVPASRLDEYERLVDLIREEPAVTKQLYVDLKRLVSAAVVSDETS
jgi:hypothetical protein